MQNYTLNQIKKILLEGKYRFSIHAEAKLLLDGLNKSDVISSILNSNYWYKREIEENESKYTFIGSTYDGLWIYSVGKVIKETKENIYY